MFENKPYLKLAFVATICSFAIGVIASLLINIFEKKQQAKYPFYQVAQITDLTEDPAEWGKNFPHQYHTYLKTVDQVRTRYGGSEAVPHLASAKDPRVNTAQSRLEEDPRLKIMWAGYAFSKDFREERGHAYMLEDQKYTERQNVVKQPGACLNCHASTYVLMKQLGNGDLFKGFQQMNSTPYAEIVKSAKHPVSCIDCHTPGTMKLRVTRPAFIEGIKAFKKFSKDVANYDVNQMASPQEMRTFVCAQCHVEYYFKGPDKQLTFPWTNGIKADQILEYYEQNDFKDWEHALTGAPTLKAQHPEFEMFQQGIHHRAGVSCTDCHMPYQRVGAFKITDHHVQSPLLTPDRSCRTCHNTTESEIVDRATQIQSRTAEVRGIAMDALLEFIEDLKVYKGQNNQTLKAARLLHRKAQFLLDFVEAENSMGFHAPGEALRLLSLSINYSRKGQNLVSKLKKPGH